MTTLLGWVLIAVASAIPAGAGLLFGWDRSTLAKEYFWLGIAAVLLWSAAASLRRHAD